MRRGVLIAAVVVSAACAPPHRYVARPWSPAAALAGFDARSLDDEGLRGFLTKSGVDPEGRDLETLTVAALYFDPALDVARAEVGVAEAEELAAGARTNPVFGFVPERSLNSPKGTSPWVLGLDLELTIETAGKRGIRSDAAAHRTEASRLDLAQAGWEARDRVRRALLDHLLSRRRLEALRDEREETEGVLRLLEARRNAGETSAHEVEATRTEAAALDLEIGGAETDVETTRTAVAKAVGVPPRALAGADLRWGGAGLEGLPDPAGFEGVDFHAEAVRNRFDLRRAIEAYAAAESDVRLEVANQYPDLHLGPGFTYDQGQHKIRFGFQLPLPLRNRNEGPIAEAEARRRKTAAVAESEQALVLAETDRALADYRGAFAGVRAARSTIETILRRRLEAARAALAAGETGRLPVARLAVEAAKEERAAIEELRRAQEALGALESAIERPLDGRKG